MSRVRRAVDVLERRGPLALARRSLAHLTPSVIVSIYQQKIWPRLPPVADHGTYNGISVRGDHPMLIDDAGVEIRHRPFDRFVPWNTPSHVPDFKAPNLDAVEEYFTSGDEVIVIGGGNGVTAVTTARQVEEDGRVRIYEADADRIEDLLTTLEYNGVADRCEVEHAIVGRAHSVANTGDAAVVDPSSLPAWDGLEMDCEGAELDVLQAMEGRPETIVVEIHHDKEFAPYDSPVAIRNLLEEMGYETTVRDGPWVNGLCVGTLAEGP